MEETKETTDFSVNGPGSPISLKKIIEADLFKKAGSNINVLLDQSHSGFYTTDAPVVEISPEDCKEQALYYKNNSFNGTQLSWSLLKYILYWAYEKHNMVDPPHEADPDKVTKFLMTDPKGKALYDEICNKINYIDHNKEWLQMVGFILLVGGALNIARKEKKGCRIFLVEPETHLHPKRERLIFSVLNHLNTEYGGGKDMYADFKTTKENE